MQIRRAQCAALLTAAVAALAAVGPALALERPFPAFAKRGTMRPDQFPAIVIDGKSRILTPGARIWNANNLTEIPSALPARSLVVNYTEDDLFYIDRIWILNDEEAARSPREQNINQPRR